MPTIPPAPLFAKEGYKILAFTISRGVEMPALAGSRLARVVQVTKLSDDAQEQLLEFCPG